MDEYSILNTNGYPYELASETILENELHNKENILLVGYAGAGPYPQCFEFDNEKEKLEACKLKKNSFSTKLWKYIKLTKPIAFAPFAPGLIRLDLGYQIYQIMGVYHRYQMRQHY